MLFFWIWFGFVLLCCAAVVVFTIKLIKEHKEVREKHFARRMRLEKKYETLD